MDEAVKVHNNFLYQQYVKNEEKKHSFGEKDPFIAEEHEICVRQGYVYKIWRLENKRRLCIRSTIHSYKSKTVPEDNSAPKVVFQNTYTLMEYENAKSNWKTNLDLMMAQCLTKEVQDNSCKVSRWVVQSLLAGVEHIKFAFVTRRKVKDPSSHVILGTYGIDTKSFCNQVNLNMATCWAILQQTIDCVYAYGEQSGDYVFMKDPNKAIMRLYKVTAEEEDDDEAEEDL